VNSVGFACRRVMRVTDELSAFTGETKATLATNTPMIVSPPKHALRSVFFIANNLSIGVLLEVAHNNREFSLMQTQEKTVVI
jgi:hypothetical protein